jgi:Ca-activated chloride channel homolog
MKSGVRLAIALLFTVFLVHLSMAAQTASPSAADSQPPSDTATVAKDQGGYVLHMNVKLVNVFTNVTDATGAIVGGLTKDDFAISEDGRPQRIAVFERQSELPLSLVLAIDTSGSVHKDLPLEQEAARKFVHFTNQANRIDRGLASLRGGPATALYDAIYLASENLAKQTIAGKPGRKVIVLVTDGGDTANTVTYAEALEQALRGEVMVYSIIDVPIAASAGRDTGGEHALITLAEQTGGKYFYANEGGLDKAFAQVSEDLRTQYLLGYYPANQRPGMNFHRIHVTVPRAEEKAFDIRYRSGYYADATSAN